MLMADANNDWMITTSGEGVEEFEGFDNLDDYSIDLDVINSILSEDIPFQNSPEDLSCNNSFQGVVVPSEVNDWSQSELQNGIHEFEDVPQKEDGLPVSSEWHHTENLVPSDSMAGIGSEQMFEFPETSGMVFDHGKVDSVAHTDSPVRPCSVSLTDWSTMSCVEHDTCSSMEGDGGSMNAPLYGHERSLIPTIVPSGSMTFNFASGDSSGFMDNVNLIDLNDEKDYDFRHAENSQSKCASHLSAIEESYLAFGSHGAIYENSMEDPGGLEKNFHTFNPEIVSTDVGTPLPNPHPTAMNGIQVSDMHYGGRRSYTEQFFCERSSTIAASSTCTDINKFLPHCFDFTFKESKQEKMSCTEGEVEDQRFLSESICSNSKMNVNAGVTISGLSDFPNASAINFSTTNKCQGAGIKHEASSHCSTTGIESSCDADGSSSSDSSRKSLPGSRLFLLRKKEMVWIQEDQSDEFHAYNRASYHPLKAVEGYCSSVSRSSSCGVEDEPCADQASSQFIPGTQLLITTKRREVCVKDERKCELILPRNMNSHHVKVNGVVKGNNSVYMSSVDDEADICILEDISDPRNVAPARVHGKSLMSSQQPDSNPLYDIGMGSARLKAIDERTTFRAALEDLSQPTSETVPPDGALAVPLLRHQRIALAWMVQKETKNMHCCYGGILADDQGLGKTISTIALILTERPPSSKVSSICAKQIEAKAFNLDDDDDGGVLQLNRMQQESDSGSDLVNKSSMKNEKDLLLAKGRPAAGTLVVCPTSVLRQWADELHNKVSKEFNLSVLVYHGSNRTKDPLELTKFDVVLTTYAIVSMEVPKQPLVDKEDEEKRQEEGHGLSPMDFSSSKKRKYPPSADKKSRKNKKGMDGTLLESLARPLARVGWFRVVLDEAQSIKNHRTQVARACWGLRAKRRWCLSGTPIQNAIDDLYSYFRFLRYDPYAAYKSFCSMIKVPISRNPIHGYKKLQAVLKTIMLRRTKGTFLDGEPIINLPPKSIELKRVEFSVEERDFYSKLEADSRAQFKVYAAAGTVKQNYVNILLMLLRLRQACDHSLLVKGYDSCSVWRSSIETAKKLAREKQIELLNCLEACSEICCLCNDPPEDAVVTICGHTFCNQCILEYLTGDENLCPASQCKVHLNISSVFSRDTLRSSLSDQPKHENSASQPIETPEPCSHGLSASSKIKAALQVLKALSKPQDSPKNSSWKSNNEVTLCTDNTTDSHSQDKKCFNTKIILNDSSVKVPEKAIVFSQWTRMLDLVEVHLKNSSIQYRRLDGTMSVLARDRAVKDFNTLPEVTVMIMSLKAASLGLNMVAACHVILLDLWWNPTTEDQAIDRAHRIGQTRPVTVLRLTVKDTVEDRILALQQKKRVMVASAFGEDETGGRQTRLTVDDLKYLFMA